MNTQKALARNGKEIQVGHSYLFAEVRGTNVVRRVVRIIDADSVEVYYCYPTERTKTTRWACNALYEVDPDTGYEI